MLNYRYKSDTLSERDRSFLRNTLAQLVHIFGVKYEICVRIEDFARTISVGVLNPKSDTAVIIYLKRGESYIFHPISSTVIQKVNDHFTSMTTEDLLINFS